MEITIVSLDEKWREFMCQRLGETPPYEGEKAELVKINFLNKDSGLSVEDILTPEGKKIAIFTHPGAGSLAEHLLERGVSVINGGQFADATWNNGNFVTLQAAQNRFFVAPVDDEGERETLILVRTKRDIS